MGTGGWLVTGFNILKNKYKDRILLSGGEVKSTTFQYGLMNLILTLKQFPHDVQCESSLTHINLVKHHFILTNPPFQTDKKFDQI
jgi:type I restriction-modification system DNA methylase subunit